MTRPRIAMVLYHFAAGGSDMQMHALTNIAKSVLIKSNISLPFAVNSTGKK